MGLQLAGATEPQEGVKRPLAQHDLAVGGHGGKLSAALLLAQRRLDFGTGLLLKCACFQLMEPTGWLHLDPAIWAQVRDWPPGVNDFWSLLIGGLVCADDKDERGFRQFC